MSRKRETYTPEQEAEMDRLLRQADAREIPSGMLIGSDGKPYWPRGRCPKRTHYKRGGRLSMLTRRIRKIEKIPEAERTEHERETLRVSREVREKIVRRSQS